MKRTEYEKTFEVGKDEDGRRVFLTVELRRYAAEYTTTGAPIVRETVTHEKVTDYLELSICGTVQSGGGGQIRDVLDSLSTYTIPQETIREIGRVWDRWHLNGMKAACSHQPDEWTCPRCKTVNGWHLTPTYPKRGDSCTNCGLDRWDVGKSPYVGGWHVLLPDGSTFKVLATEEAARQVCGEPRAVILSFVFRPDPNPCPNGYRYGTVWLVDPLPAEVAEQVKTWGADQGKRNAYAEQAREFLQRFGLTIRAAFKGDKCPPWEDGSCIHGDRYRVTVRRLRTKTHDLANYPFKDTTPQNISFDFWNSQAEMQAGGRPSAYTVLSMLSSEAFAPTDPDEVVREFGEMKPSQAVAVARFATKLQNFFTTEELEALGEIR
jgi:hypothetical protein